MTSRVVLVVDDDRLQAAALAHQLILLGVEPVVATTPDEAEELCVRHQAACALVDLHLGDRSGLALIKRLRVLAPELRAVAMTGMGQASFYLSVARAVGVIAELQKPISIDALTSVIGSIIPLGDYQV